MSMWLVCPHLSLYLSIFSQFNENGIPLVLFVLSNILTRRFPSFIILTSQFLLLASAIESRAQYVLGVCTYPHMSWSLLPPSPYLSVSLAILSERESSSIGLSTTTSFLKIIEFQNLRFINVKYKVKMVSPTNTKAPVVFGPEKKCRKWPTMDLFFISKCIVHSF